MRSFNLEAVSLFPVNFCSFAFSLLSHSLSLSNFFALSEGLPSYFPGVFFGVCVEGLNRSSSVHNRFFVRELVGGAATTQRKCKKGYRQQGHTHTHFRRAQNTRNVWLRFVILNLCWDTLKILIKMKRDKTN